MVEIFSLIQSLPFVAKFLISAVVVFVALAILVIVWTPLQITQEKNSLSAPPSATIEQQTKGDNSPAVQGVGGDVNISIDQNQSQKGRKEK